MRRGLPVLPPFAKAVLRVPEDDVRKMWPRLPAQPLPWFRLRTAAETIFTYFVLLNVLVVDLADHLGHHGGIGQHRGVRLVLNHLAV